MWLSLQRVDDFEKRKTVKVGISSANLPNSMFTHEDGRVRVVQQVACEVRSFSENLLRNHRVSLRRHQYAEARGGKHRLDEAPSLRYVPGLAHDTRVGGHAQKLVKNRPGRIPGIRASARLRWRSNQPRQAAWNGESASEA